MPSCKYLYGKMTAIQEMSPTKRSATEGKAGPSFVMKAVFDGEDVILSGSHEDLHDKD